MMLLSTVVGGLLLAAPLSCTVQATSTTPSSASPAATGSESGQFTDARFTWYNSSVGLGACGKLNPDSSFTVALNQEQFGPGYPGKYCFKEITITYKGKSHDATIMDMCPEASCKHGALDLTVGLFEFFEPLGTGVIFGEWSFKDGSSNSTGHSASTVPDSGDGDGDGDGNGDGDSDNTTDTSTNSPSSPATTTSRAL